MSKESFWNGAHPDGRWKPGFGFYLTFFMALLGGFLWLVYAKSDTTEKEARGKGVSAARIAQAVKQTAAVEEPVSAPTMKSERSIASIKEASQTAAPTLPPSAAIAPAGSSVPTPLPADNTENALDVAINVAQHAVDRERPAAPDGPTLPGVVRLVEPVSTDLDHSEPDSSTAGGGRGLANLGENNDGSHPTSGAVHQQNDHAQSTGGQDSFESLEIYRRKADSPAGVKATTPPTVAAGKWKPGKFLPRGHPVPLYLLDTIRTDSVQPIITFAVAKDVKFQGVVVIPFGTRVLMSVAGAPALGQRVVATPSSFQFPDGTELSVSGVVKGEDGVTGLESYYIPPPTWVQLSGYVNDFLSGYLALIYAKQQQLHSITIGTVSVGTQADAFDPKLEAISATSNVIRDFAHTQMTELQARYAPYMTVPAGIPCSMQLIAPLTIEAAGIDVAPLAKVEEPSKKASVPSPLDDALATAKRYGAEAAAATRAAASGQ